MNGHKQYSHSCDTSAHTLHGYHPPGRIISGKGPFKRVCPGPMGVIMQQRGFAGAGCYNIVVLSAYLLAWMGALSHGEAYVKVLVRSGGQGTTRRWNVKTQ